MWQAEPPVQPNNPTPAIYVAAKPNPKSTQQRERIFGVCQPVEINTGSETDATIFAISAAAQYMYKYEKKQNFYGDGTKAKVTLIQEPEHGGIAYIDDVPVKYSPNKDYEGSDSFVVQVEQNGVKVKVKYFILVDYPANLKYITCPETPSGQSGWWKISQSDFNPGTQDYAAWLRSSKKGPGSN